MRIAIQGERGSFSHQAALALAPALTELQACALSPEVFERVVDGRADAAVVPIENSLAGSVLEHYDLLLAQPVEIRAERLLRIRHHLIAAPGVELAAVREVYSHPVALAQCRNFFAANPKLRALPFYDTAGAPAHPLAARAPVAGIAREQLAAGLEDNAANYTRFLLLAREHAPMPMPGQERPDKVSLAFAVANKPGALVGALSIFAGHGLNLSRLESRPVPGSPWQYVFYAAYQLNAAAQAAAAAEQALAALGQVCSFVKELGRYRAAPVQNGKHDAEENRI